MPKSEESEGIPMGVGEVKCLHVSLCASSTGVIGAVAESVEPSAGGMEFNSQSSQTNNVLVASWLIARH